MQISHHTRKIVIAGISVYGLNNLSDDAMLAVFTKELHTNIPDLEITLLARHPDKELDESFGVKSINNLDHASRVESKGRYFNGLNAGDPPDRLIKIWDAIKDCDLLVIGGEPFIDISIGVYKGLTPYAALLITIAKFLNKPIMIHAIHMGRNLKTDHGKELTRYCIANSDLVTIREEQTRPILQNMGIKTDNVITLSDTAYGLDPILQKNVGLRILEREKIRPRSKHLIGVTFRHMYWTWDSVAWESYSSKVADICDYMINTFDADVLFIPHNTYTVDDKYMNDIPAHEDIRKKIVQKNRAHVITSRLTVNETLSLFSLLDLTFSNRRHTLIFGAIHGVIGLGVGEELHVKVTMEELGIGGDYFVDIESFDTTNIKKNLSDIWNRRKDIAAKERDALPGLRAKALKHAVLAADLIKTRKNNQGKR